MKISHKIPNTCGGCFFVPIVDVSKLVCLFPVSGYHRSTHSWRLSILDSIIPVFPRLASSRSFFADYKWATHLSSTLSAPLRRCRRPWRLWCGHPASSKRLRAGVALHTNFMVTKSCVRNLLWICYEFVMKNHNIIHNKFLTEIFTHLEMTQHQFQWGSFEKSDKLVGFRWSGSESRSMPRKVGLSQNPSIFDLQKPNFENETQNQKKSWKLYLVNLDARMLCDFHGRTPRCLRARLSWGFMQF